MIYSQTDLSESDQRFESSYDNLSNNFLSNARINGQKWADIRHQLESPDFLKSKFFKKLKEADLQKLEQCKKLQKEVDEHSIRRKKSLDQFRKEQAQRIQQLEQKRKVERDNEAKPELKPILEVQEEYKEEFKEEQNEDKVDSRAMRKVKATKALINIHENNQGKSTRLPS